MKQSVRIAIVAAMVVAAGVVVSSRVPAHAVQGLESGYWWQGQPDGAPFPPPSNVPANGLWVSGSQANQVAIAAIRFQLAPGEAAPVLTAKVNTATPPAQASSGANAGQVVVLACPASPAWKPAQAGAWSARPQYDCAGAATGTLAADGTTMTFDLGGIVTDSAVDVALVPGNGAAVLPPNPVPGAPTSPQPAGFDLTLQPVTADQVHTSAAASAGTSDGGLGNPPIDVAAPSTDVAAAPDLGSAGAAGNNFNFAATAVQPSTGVAGSSVPSVAPGSLAPQSGASAESAIKDNKGYRVLAVILLAVLLWWAWRQAVTPRPHRRTIYDGPAPGAA